MHNNLSMNNITDDELTALFEQTNKSLADEDFTQNVMLAIEKRQRMLSRLRFTYAIAVFIIGIMLTPQLLTMSSWVSDFLFSPIIQLTPTEFQPILAPFNSLAVLITFIALTLYYFWKRIVR